MDSIAGPGSKWLSCLEAGPSGATKVHFSLPRSPHRLPVCPFAGAETHLFSAFGSLFIFHCRSLFHTSRAWLRLGAATAARPCGLHTIHRRPRHGLFPGGVLWLLLLSPHFISIRG
jgi:hypothetical protein